MEPKSKLWKLEPHSAGKHFVLREYLNAWLPIMGSRNTRILFIDGFAGPGEYIDGQEGSPIIALKALRDHTAQKNINAEVGFMFIEEDKRRVDHLQSLVGTYEASISCNCWIRTIHGVFDETMSGVMDALDAQNSNLAPSFVMIDPFGISDTPMSVISRILRNDKSEIYISFMYESINRFKKTKDFEPQLDRLFGTPRWRHGIGLTDAEDRKIFFYNLYADQLKSAGALQVVRFKLYEGNRQVYSIFFATKHVKGSDLIKRAIWKVAPWGDFAFRGSKSPQLSLGLHAVDYDLLRSVLVAKYRGKGLVSIKELEEFVMSDKTDFYKAQLRKHALIPLESAGGILVDESTRNTKKTYPPRTLIRFT